MTRGQYETPDVTFDGGIITVELSRPERLNSINAQMVDDPHAVVEDSAKRLTDATSTRRKVRLR